MASNEEITGPVVSQDDIEAAEKLKNEANEYFKSKFIIKSYIKLDLLIVSINRMYVYNI